MHNSNHTNMILPEVVYIARCAESDEMTQRLLNRLGDVKRVVIDNDGDPITELGLEIIEGQGTEAAANRISLGKKRLLITHHKGDWLKKCPGTNNHICCNLWVLDPMEGCPFDCSYCFLQSYMQRRPTQRIYTNINEMLNSITTTTQANPNRQYRICTGELADSLAWDSYTDLSTILVPFFAKFDNLVLELKTKSISIDNLLAMKQTHGGKTVVSWTLNTDNIAENEELHTASIDQRIEAARRVSEAGYRVAFHFDPVVYFEGWEVAYSKVIKQLFANVSHKNIAWISVACLRYCRDMHEIVQHRFQDSKLPFGEQFLAKDNKLRYMQPLRLRMTRHMFRELKAINSDLPVYMCMESPFAWRSITGGLPAAGQELREVFFGHS